MSEGPLVEELEKDTKVASRYCFGHDLQKYVCSLLPSIGFGCKISVLIFSCMI